MFKKLNESSYWKNSAKDNNEIRNTKYSTYENPLGHWRENDYEMRLYIQI